MRTNRWILPALFVLLLAAGCRQQAQESAEPKLNISLRVEPETPTVGEATLIVTISDSAGNPVIASRVSARGDMNHAGMVPVLADAEDSEDNIYYIIPFEWTMAGDWLVEITVELPDGTTASESFDLSVAAGASGGMMEMDEAEATEVMDMGDHAEMPAEATETMDMGAGS